MAIGDHPAESIAYLLDLEQAPTESSTTFGLRYSDDWTLAQVKLAGFATLAEQEDRGDNPLSFRDDYLAAELTATARQWGVGVGIEVLEGDGVKGFSTPTITLTASRPIRANSGRSSNMSTD